MSNQKITTRAERKILAELEEIANGGDVSSVVPQSEDHWKKLKDRGLTKEVPGPGMRQTDYKQVNASKKKEWSRLNEKFKLFLTNQRFINEDKWNSDEVDDEYAGNLKNEFNNSGIGDWLYGKDDPNQASLKTADGMRTITDSYWASKTFPSAREAREYLLETKNTKIKASGPNDNGRWIDYGYVEGEGLAIVSPSGIGLANKKTADGEVDEDDSVESTEDNDSQESSKTDRENFDGEFKMLQEHIKQLAPYILETKDANAAYALKALKDSFNKIRKMKNMSAIDHPEKEYDKMEGRYMASLRKALRTANYSSTIVNSTIKALKNEYKDRGQSANGVKCDTNILSDLLNANGLASDVETEIRYNVQEKYKAQGGSTSNYDYDLESTLLNAELEKLCNEVNQKLSSTAALRQVAKQANDLIRAHNLPIASINLETSAKQYRHNEAGLKKKAEEDFLEVVFDDGSVGELYKEDNRWHEAGDGPDGWGTKTYMGYLSHSDLLHWLNQDYGRVKKLASVRTASSIPSNIVNATIKAYKEYLKNIGQKWEKQFIDDHWRLIAYQEYAFDRDTMQWIDNEATERYEANGGEVTPDGYITDEIKLDDTREDIVREIVEVANQKISTMASLKTAGINLQPGDKVKVYVNWQDEPIEGTIKDKSDDGSSYNVNIQGGWASFPSERVEKIASIRTADSWGKGIKPGARVKSYVSENDPNIDAKTGIVQSVGWSSEKENRPVIVEWDNGTTDTTNAGNLKLASVKTASNTPTYSVQYNKSRMTEDGYMDGEYALWVKFPNSGEFEDNKQQLINEFNRLESTYGPPTPQGSVLVYIDEQSEQSLVHIILRDDGIKNKDEVERIVSNIFPGIQKTGSKKTADNAVEERIKEMVLNHTATHNVEEFFDLLEQVDPEFKSKLEEYEPIGSPGPSYFPEWMRRLREFFTTGDSIKTGSKKTADNSPPKRFKNHLELKSWAFDNDQETELTADGYDINFDDGTYAIYIMDDNSGAMILTASKKTAGNKYRVGDTFFGISQSFGELGWNLNKQNQLAEALGGEDSIVEWSEIENILIGWFGDRMASHGELAKIYIDKQGHKLASKTGRMIYALKEELEAELGRTPTEAEIEKKINMKFKKMGEGDNTFGGKTYDGSVEAYKSRIFAQMQEMHGIDQGLTRELIADAATRIKNWHAEGKDPDEATIELLAFMNKQGSLKQAGEDEYMVAWVDGEAYREINLTYEEAKRFIEDAGLEDWQMPQIIKMTTADFKEGDEVKHSFIEPELNGEIEEVREGEVDVDFEGTPGIDTLDKKDVKKAELSNQYNKKSPEETIEDLEETDPYDGEIEYMEEEADVEPEHIEEDLERFDEIQDIVQDLEDDDKEELKKQASLNTMSSIDINNELQTLEAALASPLPTETRASLEHWANKLLIEKSRRAAKKKVTSANFDYFIDPYGEVFSVPLNHNAWVKENRKMLKERYGIIAKDKEPLIDAGWTYISRVRWITIIGNPSKIPYDIKQAIIFNNETLVINDEEYLDIEEKEQAMERNASVRVASYAPGDRVDFYVNDDPYDPNTRQKGTINSVTDDAVNVTFDDGETGDIPLQGVNDGTLTLEKVGHVTRIANDPLRDTVNFKGIHIGIEWPKGTERKYADGYSQMMSNDYGYVLNTEGEDGEEIDCYICDQQELSDKVFRIEQLNDDGEFDEYKFMLGYTDEEEAQQSYEDHMPPEKFGAIEEIALDDFKQVAHTSNEELGVN